MSSVNAGNAIRYFLPLVHANFTVVGIRNRHCHTTVFGQNQNLARSGAIGFASLSYSFLNGVTYPDRVASQCSPYIKVSDGREAEEESFSTTCATTRKETGFWSSGSGSARR